MLQVLFNCDLGVKANASWGSCAERPGSAVATRFAYAALCTHETCRLSHWRLQGEILEGTGVPGPQRCLNQTLSKGQEAFAHRLPRGREAPADPTPPALKQRQYKDRWQTRGDRRGKQFTQHRKSQVKEERKKNHRNQVKLTEFR